MKRITIISDFSKTLTSSDNPTTWSVLALSGLLGEEYLKQRENLYNLYHNYELAGDRSKTREWFMQHLQLMVDSGLCLDHIKEVVKKPEYFSPRDGLKDFLQYLQENHIHLIIITSGITNFIEEYFDYLGIDRPNIQIFGNELFFDENGESIGYNKNAVFCPLDDKSVFQEKLHINSGDRVFLLGDKAEDLSMYDDPYMSIGFCKKECGYDRELGKEGSLKKVIDIL